MRDGADSRIYGSLFTFCRVNCSKNQYNRGHRGIMSVVNDAANNAQPSVTRHVLNRFESGPGSGEVVAPWDAQNFLHKPEYCLIFIYGMIDIPNEYSTTLIDRKGNKSLTVCWTWSALMSMLTWQIELIEENCHNFEWWPVTLSGVKVTNSDSLGFMHIKLRIILAE